MRSEVRSTHPGAVTPGNVYCGLKGVRTVSGVVAMSEALPEIRRLLGKLSIEAQATANDPAASLAIMESILRAESEEELFERQQAGTTSSKDYVLRPFRLLPENIAWKRSGQGYVEQGGFPFYALLRVTDIETGNEVVVDSGSTSVLSVLERSIDLDDESRPMEKRFYERFRKDGGRPLQFVPKAVQSGYNVITLMPVVLAAASEPESTRGKSKR